MITSPAKQEKEAEYASAFSLADELTNQQEDKTCQ